MALLGWKPIRPFWIKIQMVNVVAICCFLETKYIQKAIVLYRSKQRKTPRVDRDNDPEENFTPFVQL